MMSNLREDSTIENVMFNPETFILIEISLIEVNKSKSNPKAIGWTFFDIFDFSGGLNYGLWKCPFYLGDVNT